MKIYTIAAIAGMASAIALSADAQSATSSTNSQANNTANQVSASGAIAAGGAVIYNEAPQPATTSSTLQYEGTYEVRSAPPVAAPGIITAFNCAQGVSAGASVIGGGISFGGTYTDKNCERIAQAAAINTLAGRSAALIHLAKSPEICVSLRQAGAIGPNSICSEDDRKRAAAAAAAPTASTRGVAVAYNKCEMKAGKIHLTVRSGADKATAISQCRTALK